MPSTNNIHRWATGKRMAWGTRAKMSWIQIDDISNSFQAFRIPCEIRFNSSSSSSYSSPSPSFLLFRFPFDLILNIFRLFLWILLARWRALLLPFRAIYNKLWRRIFALEKMLYMFSHPEFISFHSSFHWVCSHWEWVFPSIVVDFVPSFSLTVGACVRRFQCVCVRA